MDPVVPAWAKLFREKEISRRQFIQGAAAMGCSLATIQTLLTACVPAPTPAPASASPVAPTPPPEVAPTPAAPSRGEGTLTVADAIGWSTLDTYFWTQFREQDLCWVVQDSLTIRPKTGGGQFHVAESAKHIDANTWQFKIREGIKFPDGTDLDAEAVVYGVNRSLDSELAATLYVKGDFGWTGAEAIDKYTVNIKTSKCASDTAMMDQMGRWGIPPESYYSKLTPAEASKVIYGSGPFSFVEFVKDDHLILEAKPDYWDSQAYWGGPVPKFKTLVTKAIPEPATRVAALEAGDIDICFDVGLDQVAPLNGKNGITSTFAESETRLFIGINEDQPYMRDVRVRKALNYAVDWEPINQSIFGGKAPRARLNCGFMTPQSPHYNPNIKPYDYQPDLAKELLASAGVPKGYHMVMEVPGPGWVIGGVMMAQAVAADYAKVGLDIEVVEVDPSIMWKKMVDNQTAPLVFQYQGGGGYEALTTFETIKPGFFLDMYNWNQEEWMRLHDLLVGDEACLDPEKYKEIAWQMLRIMCEEDPPAVYLAVMPFGYAWGPRVKHWEPRFDRLFLPWEVELVEGA